MMTVKVYLGNRGLNDLKLSRTFDNLEDAKEYVYDTVWEFAGEYAMYSVTVE